MPVLEPHRDRITWDAPIHSWADVEALPFRPKCLNVKPSRFGTLERLLEFYERCEEEGIALYGGGQFELSVGRGQIQLLAALFSRRRAERRRARRLQRGRAARRASRRARSSRCPSATASGAASRLTTAARALPSARRSAGSSIRANASSHVSHSAARTSAASGASVPEATARKRRSRW